MFRLIFIIIFIFLYSTKACPMSEDVSTIHQKSVGNQYISVSVKYFDGDLLHVLIPKGVWVGFLYKALRLDVRDRSDYAKHTMPFFKDGVYDFVLAKQYTEANEKESFVLKAFLSHYLVVKISFENLGYANFDDFKEKNFYCEISEGSDYCECILKVDSLTNIWHATYIMANNGFFVNTKGVIDYSGVSFIGRVY